MGVNSGAGDVAVWATGAVGGSGAAQPTRKLQNKSAQSQAKECRFANAFIAILIRDPCYHRSTSRAHLKNDDCHISQR